MKLNLGCGHALKEGYINIDADPNVGADLTHNIAIAKLPYETDSVEQVVMAHTIEHIPRDYHGFIVSEINRVLKPDGIFFCSFPHFGICAAYYLNNKFGMKAEWENAIFGRRLTIWDMHVCAMLPDDFVLLLKEFGFKNMRHCQEDGQGHHVVVYAEKAFTLKTKEQILNEEVVQR